MQFDFNFSIMYKLGIYSQDVDQLLIFSLPTWITPGKKQTNNIASWHLEILQKKGQLPVSRPQVEPTSRKIPAMCIEFPINF